MHSINLNLSPTYIVSNIFSLKAAAATQGIDHFFQLCLYFHVHIRTWHGIVGVTFTSVLLEKVILFQAAALYI